VKPFSLSQVAALLNVPMPPGPDRVFASLATLDEATEADLSLLGSEAYLKRFLSTRAGAVIVARRLRLPPDHNKLILVVDDVELATARILEMLAPPVPRPPPGIDPSARVDASASIDATAAIGPYVIVGRRSRIGPASVLHGGVFVGDDVVIGERCEIFPHVVIRERITIGNRVIIHAGSVLGTDGFGYRWDGRRHAKVPQIGTVIIEDDVEIGSCVCIDRAKISATRIGQGTKIDNLVQIGHNVQVGPHCIIVGQAGVAGSARLGARVVLGGQSAVRDHVSIGEEAMVAACSGIAEDVEPRTVVSGLPALPHRQSLREQAALRRLPALVDQVRKLQDELDKLKAARE
jgi:UDP-3-O-[3-hydroxymyristoyl] glucosamine N-acyltransferase